VRVVSLKSRLQQRLKEYGYSTKRFRHQVQQKRISSVDRHSIFWNPITLGIIYVIMNLVR